MMNGMPHGNGILAFDDGGKYEGDFDSGKKHGNGKFTWPNGKIYDGNF